MCISAGIASEVVFCCSAPTRVFRLHGLLRRACACLSWPLPFVACPWAAAKLSSSAFSSRSRASSRCRASSSAAPRLARGSVRRCVRKRSAARWRRSRGSRPSLSSRLTRRGSMIDYLRPPLPCVVQACSCGIHSCRSPLLYHNFSSVGDAGCWWSSTVLGVGINRRDIFSVAHAV